MNGRRKRLAAWVRRCVMLAPVALVGCGERGAADGKILFELLPPEATGISFVNALPEAADFNILNYLYYYNGGGVAVGDVNNDGLPDLYFTCNLGPNRLYLNRGNYRFEDVTDRAGVAGPGADGSGWTTGVTMADVNGDGHLDIYVSGVSYLTKRGRNVLYINNGDGTFTDRTAEYGLEHAGYSTQALFFDFDGDGDLDMYLLNHSTHTERGVSARPQRSPRHPTAGDKLFRNDGGRFTDVSARAGIHGGVEGYGLGVVASDFNLDGCIDLFVANDFQENDFLYLNNCDGTFTEVIGRSMGHTSRFSMGVDAADFDNDGRPDLFVLDMLPEREDILKTSANAESFNVFNLKARAGYEPQYARNTLQLNRGAPGGGGEPLFSEIGYLAGVFATDWSWTALFADLDNDGRKDLFITNGIYRRPNDMDYISFVGNEAIQESLERGITESSLALLQRMPKVPLPNYAYRNEGGLRFTNLAEEWGLAHPGFSNGAVYADLNNSGSLDLIVNNLNAPASIYRNRARELNGHHYLQVRLRGEGGNTSGIGARVVLTRGGELQMLEQMPARGFQSSVDHRLHFGLGANPRVDTLLVIWPDRRFQILTDVAVDRVLELSQRDARGRWLPEGGIRGVGGASVGRAPAAVPARRQLLADATARSGLDFVHRENDFVDYNREPLMPHLLSTQGPALAVGDVNGDGLDDLYIGGAKWQPGRLYLQQRDGTFRAASDAALRADSLHEDVDAVFFDADGDGHLDLYVVSGGNEFSANDEALRHRLYRNDGRGNFRRDRQALPEFFVNGSCVVAADFDGDGHVDLFVGGRVVAGQYGRPPRSYLLQNDGTGRLRDVTADKAPGLVRPGMVTGAAWLDHDGNGRLDLVVTGEWMPVRIFAQQTDGRFAERTAEAGLAGSNGWWNMVTTADLNGDGRPDLILGNLGLNSYIRASPEQPARLYVHDFFQNGTLEQILTFYKNGVSYPLAGRDDIVRLFPPLRSKYPSYAAYGASRIEDIFPRADLSRADVLEARTFATSIALNRGDGTFELRPLPKEAQFAPVYGALADDFDGDGRTDLLLAGNFHGVTPVRGRYDASYGLLLAGTGDGSFRPVALDDSHPAIRGEVRSVKAVRMAGGRRAIVVARNNDRPLLFHPSPLQPTDFSTKRGPR